MYEASLQHAKPDSELQYRSSNNAIIQKTGDKKTISISTPILHLASFPCRHPPLPAPPSAATPALPQKRVRPVRLLPYPCMGQHLTRHALLSQQHSPYPRFQPRRLTTSRHQQPARHSTLTPHSTSSRQVQQSRHSGPSPRWVPPPRSPATRLAPASLPNQLPCSFLHADPEATKPHHPECHDSPHA